MFGFLEQEHSDKLARTWLFITEAFGSDLNDNSIEIAELLIPPIHQKLAVQFAFERKSEAQFDFLSDEQLIDIAIEKMEKGRVRWEDDITSTSGIYVFVSLEEKLVYKAGEAQDVRSRLTGGHLRYGNDQADVNLIDYCKLMFNHWPRCLSDLEMTLLIFPLARSTKREHLFLEAGFQELLKPLMN